MYQGNCNYCGQRYSHDDKCCYFCGGPLPAYDRRFVPSASSACFTSSVLEITGTRLIPGYPTFEYVVDPSTPIKEIKWSNIS